MRESSRAGRVTPDSSSGSRRAPADADAQRKAEEQLRRSHRELDHQVRQRTAELIEANDRLMAEVEERTRAQEALRLQRDLMLKLGSTGDLTAALGLILDAALAAAGMDAGGVYLMDPEGSVLTLTATRNLSEGFVAGAMRYGSETQNFRLVALGNPIYLSSSDRAEPVVRREGFKALAVVPVMHAGQVVACVNAGSRVHDEVPGPHRALIETLAGHVGPTIARMSAERSARQQLGLLQRLLDALPYPVFYKDLSGCYLGCNRAYCESAGVPLGQVVGRTVFDLAPLEVATIHEKSDRELLSNGRSIRYESAYRAADGTLHPGLITKAILPGPDGQPVGVVGSIIDLAESKRAEEARRESEGRIRALVEAIPDLVFRFSRDGRFLEYVTTRSEALALPPEDFLGRLVVEVLPASVSALFDSALRALFVTNQSQVIEYRLVVPLPDGEPGDYEARLVRSGPDEAICLIRNITQRKATEAKLLEYQSQLQSLASELTLTEERERRRLAGLLHDQVGQTLALVKIRLGMLREEGSAPGLSAVGLEQIGKLVEQAIRETRSLTFELSPPILYELGFEPAAEWLAEQVHQQYGLRTEFSDDHQSKPLDEDVRVVLFQGVRELLVNVAKHAKASAAKVSVCRQDDRICIQVCDDGVGFDSDGTERTGFGLFSLRERLTSLGGALTVRSRVGGGCCVVLTAALAGGARK